MAARAKRVRRRPCKTLGELRPDFRLGPLKKAFRIFEAEPGWLRGYAALYSAEPPGSGARLVPWLRQVMLPHQGPAIAEDGQTQTPTVGLYRRSPQTCSALAKNKGDGSEKLSAIGLSSSATNSCAWAVSTTARSRRPCRAREDPPPKGAR